MNFIFLSKHKQDEYINMLAQSVDAATIDTKDFIYDQDSRPIVLRGILKYKIMHQCWQDRRDFYYVDSGYFGNGVTKLWHRIVKNDLQHKTIEPRPTDRWQRFGIKIPKRRYGSKIILALPDNKPCRFYGIDRAVWIENIVSQIKANTDRPIIVRERSRLRQDRVVTDPLNKILIDDIHALVTFNSIAAVESILAGVPAFVLAPTHAALPVGNTNLAHIEDPYWADEDKLLSWASHLAYGQFHVNELKNGQAMRMINEN